MSLANQTSPGDIDDLVVALLHDADGPEPAAFAADAEAKLGAAVNGFIGSRDLMIVVQRLISIAYQLEVEEKCPTAAKLIASVVEREVITRNLQAIANAHRSEAVEARVHGAGDEAEWALERFATLTAKRATRPRRTPPRIC
jgi:hypothetical protein